MVNPAEEPRDIAIRLEGVSSLKDGATTVLLAGNKLSDENSLDAPTNISPRSVSLEVKTPNFRQTIPARALLVLRVPISKESVAAGH